MPGVNPNPPQPVPPTPPNPAVTNYPDFIASSGTLGAYPLRAIRDSYEIAWEERTAPDGSIGYDREHRAWVNVSYHVDCNTFSTSVADFVTWSQWDYQIDPVLYVGTTTVGPLKVTYNGVWYVERIDCRDQGNGTSIVIVAIKRLITDWLPIAPANPP